MAEIGYSVCSKLIEVMGSKIIKEICDMLISLRVLPYFVVGKKEQSDDEPKALKGLTEIKGSIDIRIYSKYRIVEGMNDTGGAGRSSSFPRLSELVIDNCPNLKSFSSCPSLTKLNIIKCPSLTSFPPCPSLEELGLKYNNEALQIIVKSTTRSNTAGAGTSQDDDNVKLRKVEIDNLGYLKSLALNCLTHLRITVIDSIKEELKSDSEEEEIESEVGDEEIELEVVEAFQKSASSLQWLYIEGINKLKRVTGRTGLKHFSALYELTLRYADNFELSFPQNLRSLDITGSHKMTSFPMGMQYLTSLQTLNLHRCYKLKSLPEWISNLSSLQSLSISYCEALKSLPEAMQNLTSLQRLVIRECLDLIKRCEEPNGKDYHKIQHIPSKDIELRRRY
ncbi:hypothetical protein SOVF_136980 [Spinacia oleracea]|nr:hypothetical protein SOVF_136980 [Spinacia oleracea]